MAPKKPTAPEKNKNVKKASAIADAITTIGPHADAIAGAIAHGTAALGLGALGYVPYKLRQIRKKHQGRPASGSAEK